MATIVADSSGNFSATGTWTGDVVPTTGDVAQTGAYTVTIDADVTCTRIEATSSGHYEVTAGGRTINADFLMASSYTNNGGLRCTHNTGTVTLKGTVTGTSGNDRHGVCNNGTGTLTIEGECVAGGFGPFAVVNASSGTLNITGNVSGTSGTCVINNSTGPCNITGDVLGAVGSGVLNNNTGTVTVTGNVTGSSTTLDIRGINNASTGTVNVSGSATGGSVAGSVGLYNSSTGTCTCDMAVGGASNSAYGLFGINSGGTTTYKRIGSQTNGMQGVGGFCKMVVDQDYNVLIVKDSAGNDVSMSNDYPAVTDVKDGVIYNRTTLEGTYVEASGGGFQQSGAGFGFKR